MLKEKKSVLIILFLAVMFGIVFGAILKSNKDPDSEVQPETSVKAEESTTIGCTRKTRLENLPQYDRALSLIQQRLLTNQERFKYNDRALFTYFHPELTNCIKIVEEESVNPDEFEGYFTFNGSDIRNNYYPIVVNSKYVQSDDVLISLLLVHEMTHVQQYVDSVNKIKTYSCVDGEVDAFMASRLFYISGLNEEEMNAVTLRIYEAVDNYDPTGLSQKFNRPFDGQLLMLDTIQNLYSSPTLNCKRVKNPSADEASWKAFGDSLNCIDSQVPLEFKKIIESNEYYKKQCDL